MNWHPTKYIYSLACKANHNDSSDDNVQMLLFLYKLGMG